MGTLGPVTGSPEPCPTMIHDRYRPFRYTTRGEELSILNNWFCCEQEKKEKKRCAGVMRIAAVTTRRLESQGLGPRK